MNLLILKHSRAGSVSFETEVPTLQWRDFTLAGFTSELPAITNEVNEFNEKLGKIINPPSKTLLCLNCGGTALQGHLDSKQEKLYKKGYLVGKADFDIFKFLLSCSDDGADAHSIKKSQKGFFQAECRFRSVITFPVENAVSGRKVAFPVEKCRIRSKNPVSGPKTIIFG